MNLEKQGDSMRHYSHSSCSIAFLRNVEPQESPEYSATGLFCAFKRLFLLLRHLSGV